MSYTSEEYLNRDILILFACQRLSLIGKWPIVFQVIGWQLYRAIAASNKCQQIHLNGEVLEIGRDTNKTLKDALVERMVALPIASTELRYITLEIDSTLERYTVVETIDSLIEGLSGTMKIDILVPDDRETRHLQLAFDAEILKSRIAFHKAQSDNLQQELTQVLEKFKQL